MTEISVREQAVLDLLRNRYESQGGVFFAYPIGPLVPPFLGDYRPDAIVKKPDGQWLVVEVQHAMSPSADHKLANLAATLRGQKDWSLLVVTPDEFPQLRQQFAAGSAETIADAIREMDILETAGHSRAAFLTGWAVLEALGRSRLERVLKNPNQSFGPATLAETLEQYGLVSASEGRTLRSLIPMRNSVAHGDLAYQVTDLALQNLRGIIRSLESTELVGSN